MVDKFKNDKERLDELLIPRAEKDRQEIERGRLFKKEKIKELQELIQKEDIEERLIFNSNHFIQKSNDKWKIVSYEIRHEYRLKTWLIYYNFRLKRKAFFFPKYINIKIYTGHYYAFAKEETNENTTTKWYIDDDMKILREGVGTENLFKNLGYVFADAIESVYR